MQSHRLRPGGCCLLRLSLSERSLLITLPQNATLGAHQDGAEAVASSLPHPRATRLLYSFWNLREFALWPLTVRNTDTSPQLEKKVSGDRKDVTSPPSKAWELDPLDSVPTSSEPN